MISRGGSHRQCRSPERGVSPKSGLLFKRLLQPGQEIHHDSIEFLWSFHVDHVCDVPHLDSLHGRNLLFLT